MRIAYGVRQPRCYTEKGNSALQICSGRPVGCVMKAELACLRRKLSLLDEDNIQEMYIQKQRNQIFTYPTTPIRYDLNTYLKRK